MDLHRAPEGAGEYFRVMFPLERDEDGYPPADDEILWATKTGQGSFMLDNIPFYVRGVSWGDIVAASGSELGPLKFEGVVEPSFHWTIRVIVAKDCQDRRPLDERVADLRGKLKALGCDTESSRPGFFVVDIPPCVKLSDVRTVLTAGMEAGFWDYEEATLWHTG